MIVEEVMMEGGAMRDSRLISEELVRAVNSRRVVCPVH